MSKETSAPSSEGPTTKWRKKPVVIEARQFQPEKKPWPDGVVERHPEDLAPGTLAHGPSHYWIDTLEGGHIVTPGDWIITGVEGERYPCKPDIFAKTYEPAAHSAADRDMAFINHIQDHLAGDEEVVCKICGRTAQSIIEEAEERAEWVAQQPRNITPEQFQKEFFSEPPSFQFECSGCGETYERYPSRGRCDYCGEPVEEVGE